MIIAKIMAKVDRPNPQSHPLLTWIQTTSDRLTTAPVHTDSKMQLKKLDICLSSCGSLSSNWSAPWAGRETFMPALPVANKYRPRNRRAASPPLIFLQWEV